MKRIAILALHLGYGGIEKSISTLANSLSTLKDVEVEIISIYKLYDNPVFKISDNVKVKYLLPKSLSSTKNKEKWHEALEHFKLISLVKESAKALKILRLRKKEVIKYLKGNDLDVIISTRDFLNDLSSLYGDNKALKIGWEHNHHHNNMRYAMEIVRSAKNLDYLVLVSKDLQRFYRRQLIDYKVKCVYIPNTLEFIPKVKSPLKDKRIISVGRLSKEKGYADLLEIHKEVLKKNPLWHLDIVGDGNEKKALQNYIKNNKLEESITLHGYQDSDYISKLMYKSSIYVMTSHTESFGIVLLEAMSHGLPCLAFDSAEGAREIITSGRDGYLIRHRNKREMVKKINDLIKDELKRKELGSAGRNKIKIYSSDKVLEKWSKIINKKVKK